MFLGTFTLFLIVAFNGEIAAQDRLPRRGPGLPVSHHIYIEDGNKTYIIVSSSKLIPMMPNDGRVFLMHLVFTL